MLQIRRADIFEPADDAQPIPRVHLNLVDTAQFAKQQQVMQASLTSSAAMQHCAELSTVKRQGGCGVISPHKKAMIREIRVNEGVLGKSKRSVMY